MTPAPRNVGEIETFITMLRTACDDRQVYERLERLLSHPDEKRQAVVSLYRRLHRHFVRRVIQPLRSA
jgi:hypothetical protein